jgi:phosphoenolpyruvate carboxykinase (GTP)
LVPQVGEGGIETEGLDITEEQMHQLLYVNPAELREQLEGIEEHYAKFGDRLPAALREQLGELGRRL